LLANIFLIAEIRLLPKINLPPGLLKGRGLFKRSVGEREESTRLKIKRNKEKSQKRIKALEDMLKESKIHLKKIEEEAVGFEKKEVSMRLENH